jgi:hypothetical protein
MANSTPEITLVGDILKLHIYDKLSVIPFNTEFNIKEWEYVDFIRRSWWAPGIRRISSQHKLAPDERRLVPTPLTPHLFCSVYLKVLQVQGSLY